MIRYTLECSDAHPFDGWFANSAAFETQVERHLVSCPTCGSTDVRKAIMAPNVSVKTRGKGRSVSVSEPGLAASSTPAAAAAPVAMTNMTDAAAAEKVVAFFRAIRAAVEKNAENVGEKFAEEARKIHYGETDNKLIYGEATLADAKELIDEGIMVHPLPQLPEDKN